MDFAEAVIRAHGDQAEAEAAAELRTGLQRGQERTPLAARHGDINGIGEREAVDRLVKQRQGEAGLQLDDDGRLVAAHGHDIGGADLRLHLVALPLQQLLDRRIKVGLFRLRHDPAFRPDC
jgi:hypothetical protein